MKVARSTASNASRVVFGDPIPIPIPKTTNTLMSELSRRQLGRFVFAGSIQCALGVSLVGCRRSSALSAERAKAHLSLLSGAVRSDVDEINRGLPHGAELLSAFFAAGAFDDAAAMADVLDKTRNKVQDLRVAKSTFFALVNSAGVIMRSDQQPDLLAGKNVVSSVPELQRALKGESVRTRGKIPGAAKVRGREDAEWLAAEPVRVGSDVKGAYLSGWSWSGYAYRLENQLRSSVRSSLGPSDKEPLLYVYMLVEEQVFYPQVSPQVTAQALLDQHFFTRAKGSDVVTVQQEITDRDFGIAFMRAPTLGENVGIAVVRSET